MGPYLRIHAQESRSTQGVDLLSLAEVLAGADLERQVMTRGGVALQGAMASHVSPR